MCITSDVIFIICTLIGNSYKPISMKEFLELLCSSRKNPYPPYGRSSKIPRGRGVLKVKILEVKYKAKLEFPRGSRGANQKTFRGGSMDIFWNAHCKTYLHANLYPLIIDVGWIFCLTSSLAPLRNSAASMTTEVVPSPTS